MVTADRLPWRTSSYTSNGQACVEVASTPDCVLIRDTKDHGTGPVLSFSLREWAAFLAVPAVTVATRRTRHDGAEVVTRWHVRDALHFTDAEWHAFLAGASDGEFDFDRRLALATD